MTRDEQPTVAFVLAGGASLGAIQVGMLRALYERGLVPDVIVGTSAGALNGAFIASRPQTVATADALAEVWRDLRRGQIFPLNPLTGLLGCLGARDHLVPESGLRRLIARHIQCDQLEELAIPLHVVAVDAVSGEELRLSRGPVLDAERHQSGARLIVLPPPCPLSIQPIDSATPMSSSPARYTTRASSSTAAASSDLRSACACTTTFPHRRKGRDRLVERPACSAGTRGARVLPGRRARFNVYSAARHRTSAVAA